MSDILQGRFIKRVLSDTSVDIEHAITDKMNERGFDSDFWDKRTFKVSDSVMTYQHLLQHRFVDMRTRNSSRGKRRKKSHPIHNRIIFGHYNNIVRELLFGYTEEVINELKSLENGKENY